MSEKPGIIWVEFTWNAPYDCWYLEDWHIAEMPADYDYTCYLRKDGLPREMAEWIREILPYVPSSGWGDDAEDMLSRWDELGRNKEGGA